jgi:cytoskeletal protein RodZ
MSNDLQSLGLQFSQRRQERKLSLKEVETATSIRTGYLEAIEAGQIEKLISPIYAQGFVRQYAAYLGLDGDRIVTEFSETFRKPISQDFAYGIGTLETRGSPGGGIKWFPNVMWGVAFVFLAVAAYLLAKSLDVL